MAKYNFNIYRVAKKRKTGLLKNLRKNRLRLESTQQSEGYEISFYLSYDKKEIWWINYYTKWISEERKAEESLENINYYGVVLISNEKVCYAISLGKAHFMIKPYCEYDFGIRLAQKAIDRNNVRLTQTNVFGSNKRKSINAYLANSRLEANSGESFNTLKGGTINEGALGKNMTCGDSINLSLEDLSPKELPDLIKRIELFSNKNDLFKLPRSTKVLDEKKIQKLDEELIAKIIQASSEVGMAELVETESLGFLFKGDYYIEYLLCNRQRLELGNDFTTAQLLEAMEEKQIPIDAANILSVNVKVSMATGKERSMPLKAFLDYVNPEKYHLQEGKWYQFNQKFLEDLDASVDLIPLVRKALFDDAKQQYQNWLTKQAETPKPPYFEQYFNEYVMSEQGFINLDRETQLSDQDEFRRYKLEIADALKDDLLVFVKKGNPQKLNYVIDQSLTTFKYLQENNWTIRHEDTPIRIRKMCLLLLIERRPFEQLHEINSLIFKIKLDQWRRKLMTSNIEPIIWTTFLK